MDVMAETSLQALDLREPCYKSLLPSALWTMHAGFPAFDKYEVTRIVRVANACYKKIFGVVQPLSVEPFVEELRVPFMQFLMPTFSCVIEC